MSEIYPSGLGGGFPGYVYTYPIPATTPPAPDEEIDKLEGSNWQIGVALPFCNMSFDKYEKNFRLLVKLPFKNKTDTLQIQGDLFFRDSVKSGSKIFIGPSSNRDRDTNGELIHFGKTMSATIKSSTIEEDGDGNLLSKIIIEGDPFDIDGYNAIYEVGDNATIKSVAEGWDFIRDEHLINSLFSSRTGETEVAGIWPQRFSAGTDSDKEIMFDRIDPLFQRKGFSQKVLIDNNANFNGGATTTITRRAGIIQTFKKRNSTFLANIRGKDVRVSGWIRYRYDGDTFAIPKIGFAQYTRPYLDDSGIGGSKVEFFTQQNLGFSSKDRWVTGKVTVLDNAVNGGIYAFTELSDLVRESELRLDFLTGEHAIGTSQECNGFFEFPTCPEAGALPIEVNRLPRRIQKASGETEGLFIKNSVPLYTIKATFERVTMDFINDMKIFQEYSDTGAILLLRTFLFETMPPVLFCKIKMEDPILRGERNLDTYNQTITFEEVLT